MDKIPAKIKGHMESRKEIAMKDTWTLEGEKTDLMGFGYLAISRSL